jgi:DNA-binding IclR family transcriptional regulator
MVESDLPIRIVSHVGESLPLHCTAVGNVHLAFEPPEEVQRIFPEGLARYTDQTITDRHALRAHLREVTNNGYAIENGEYIRDVRAIAVPIRDYTRAVVGSLAVCGPAYRIAPDRIQAELVPLIVRAGSELSNRLGYHS